MIRRAELKDLEALLAIYNDEVEHGVATFDLHPKTLAQWRVWFDQHNIDNHPLIVAEIDGVVAGYASLSSYREKEAYRSTAELSVYIASSFRRRGVASVLMESILTMAREDPSLHVVVSVITSGNEASVKLHQRFGFDFCGRLYDVGVKFGKFLSIDHFELKV